MESCVLERGDRERERGSMSAQEMQLSCVVQPSQVNLQTALEASSFQNSFLDLTRSLAELILTAVRIFGPRGSGLLCLGFRF